MASTHVVPVSLEAWLTEGFAAVHTLFAELLIDLADVPIDM